MEMPETIRIPVDDMITLACRLDTDQSHIKIRNVEIHLYFLL